MTTPQDLVVRAIGEGFPVLVIHGWLMSGRVEASDFEPIFTQRPGYRRIYVDLPGMGGAPLGGIKDLDSILQVLSHFVVNHIFPSTFLLIGTSCGAYLARALAYKYASAVEGLLLRVPVVEPDSSMRNVDPFLPVISDEAILLSLSEADREKLGEVTVQTPKYIDTVKRKLEDFWLPAMAASDSTTLDLIRNGSQSYRLNAMVHSPGDPFPKPTLILTGRQDTDVGYRDAWPLVQCYSRATFVALDRADHGFPVDERGLFEALVADWLSRVEETRRLTPSIGNDRF